MECNYNNEKNLIEHKIAMAKKIFWRDLGFMIFEKIASFYLELLEVRIQYKNCQNSWQEILNLKRNHQRYNIFYRARL